MHLHMYMNIGNAWPGPSSVDQLYRRLNKKKQKNKTCAAPLST